MELGINEVSLVLNGKLDLGNNLSLNFPTVNEFLNPEFEKKYYSLLSNLISTPTDLAYQLDQIGVDFTEIDPYEMFIKYLAPNIKNDLSRVLFNDEFDFSKCIPITSKSGEIMLKQHIIKNTEKIVNDNHIKKSLWNKSVYLKTETTTNEYDICFDRITYKRVIKALTYLHGLKQNNDKPGNNGAKKLFILKSKQNFKKSKSKSNSSQMLNIISSLVNNSSFKYNWETILDINICQLMNSFNRIMKHERATLILQSGYSGFGLDLKDIDKKEIDWSGDL